MIKKNNADGDFLLIAGMMTGNSLDGADAVLTRFYADGRMEDAGAATLPFSTALSDALRALRSKVEKANGNIERAAREDPSAFRYVSDAYIRRVAETIRALPTHAGAIDAVGLHGQTCAHCPPSAASKNGAYTVQIADAGALADALGITTIYDFRSDDIFAGGEGAPFAPLYFLHLAPALRARAALPVLMINAGNTANLTLIYETAPLADTVLGWDAGPCNHFPDMLMREEKNLPFDPNGAWGKQGKIDVDLLRTLFLGAAVTAKGENFLELLPPKSSDPLWYKRVPALFSDALPFADRLRTAEYFSAYIIYHALGSLPEGAPFPTVALLTGGGRHNAVTLEALGALAQGDAVGRTSAPVLPEHRERFASIRRRGSFRVAFSEELGIDGHSAEARIFAVAAHRRICGAPFTLPAVTGCARPAVCGLIRFPHNDAARASAALLRALPPDDPARTTRSQPDLLWSRASAGSPILSPLPIL
ncbi:MAG: anhydro-N-acetylmuramic acid kinase [Rickettsiales bacterium]